LEQQWTQPIKMKIRTLLLWSWCRFLEWFIEYWDPDPNSPYPQGYIVEGTAGWDPIIQISASYSKWIHFRFNLSQGMLHKTHCLKWWYYSNWGSTINTEWNTTPTISTTTSPYGYKVSAQTS
jgi:hypothetical protein